MQILIDRNGQRMGPYTPEQVNDYLAAGSLLPTDSAWHEGMPAWGPLSTVQGVVMPGAAPPPPEPAPLPQPLRLQPRGRQWRWVPFALNAMSRCSRAKWCA